jgi:type II secretory pathway component PulF
MASSVFQFFQDDPLQALGILLLVLASVLIAVSISVGALYLMYFLLTLPMRRNERARLFLDLLELGLKDGRTPEQAIVDASATHDESLGVRFHLLADHLREGLRLSQALARVPRLLPQQIPAMLEAGERIGNVSKVLPACRLLLTDGVSHVRGALNYVILLAFTMTPVSIFIPVVLRLKVLPGFRAVFDSALGGGPLPAFTCFVLDANPLFTGFQILFFGLIWVATLLYLGGPRLKALFDNLAPGVPDALLYRLPWKRKRVQRDFSAMLAVLLDAEVPEPEAVRLAAESTANEVIRSRSENVVVRLQQGAKLSEAIQSLDHSRELRWRLANALGRAGGFVRALKGWHEALDAKAFQLEQTAAQVSTTTLVLLNGLVVGCIVVGMFIAIINLINQATLW